MRARRVLVIVPGRLIRTQVADAFETLADLRSCGVLPGGIPSPRVERVEHRATAADWHRWRDVDVVVGTPNVLSDGYPDVQRVPDDLFDLVIFDEAHHLPAQVWTAILEANDAPAVLLTATPTRRDGKPLAGDLIYSYPLSQAIADEVYAPVKFVPVEWDGTDDPNKVLAQAAASRLADPLHAQAGSRLLVRTSTQKEARALVGVYESAGLDVGLILADTSPNAVRRTLAAVREGRLVGFVAVGALIEGFDFPSLKIAAYHEPHRTLAPTLQFLGRLSRASPSGVRGELLAIPDQVEGETRELYRQNRDWAELMPEIVEAAELAEREIRRYVSGAQLTGSFALPPRAFTPPRSARIYRLPDGYRPNLDVDPRRIGHAEVVFRLYDHSTSLLAVVTHRVVKQRWADTPMLEVSEFSLNLATWVERQNVLFVSTESSPALFDMLRVLDVERRVRNLAPEDLVALVYAADPGSYFSVGLRAAHARRARGASYDMTAGPAVETALDYADRNSSVLGHLMARPRDGNRGTVGFSVAKSKLWEPENARSLLDFRRWAEERAAELDNPPPSISLPGLAVNLGQPFASFPENALIAVPSYEFVVSQMSAYVEGRVVPPDGIEITAYSDGDDSLQLQIASRERVLWTGTQSPNGHITTDGTVEASVLLADTGEVISFERALRDAPPAVYFANGSVVIGDVLVPARRDVGPVAAETLWSDSWTHIEITKEIGADRTVQSRTAEIAMDDATWVVADHESGELADFIAVSATDTGITMKLFHCKRSGGPRPGRRVADLYDVIGQVVKCVPWLIDRRTLCTDLIRRLDHRTATDVIHGDPEALRDVLTAGILDPAVTVECEIVAVQPGVSVSDLDQWPAGRSLLHSASAWCTSEHTVFRLLCSP
jgi:hypothetical protein